MAKFVRHVNLVTKHKRQLAVKEYALRTSHGSKSEIYLFMAFIRSSVTRNVNLSYDGNFIKLQAHAITICLASIRYSFEELILKKLNYSATRQPVQGSPGKRIANAGSLIMYFIRIGFSSM